jgi:hypothetical protein
MGCISTDGFTRVQYLPRKPASRGVAESEMMQGAAVGGGWLADRQVMQQGPYGTHLLFLQDLILRR